MPEYVVEKAIEALKILDGKKVTVFGLPYKGDVDDIRESPAFDIYQLLLKEPDIEVTAYDPLVELNFVKKDMNKALDGSSLVLMLSDHSEFKTLNDLDFKSTNKNVPR